MARESRFIDDNEPVAPRRRESSAKKEAPRAEDDAKAENIKIERIIDDTSSIPIADEGGSGGGKRIALLIVAVLLGFAIIGAGVYALIHFVLMPENNSIAVVEATETLSPTMPDEPTLATEPPTEPPTEAPTEDPNVTLANAYLQKMSDREKMCQMFIVTPEVLTSNGDDSDDDSAVTVAGEQTKKSLEEYPVGGIIYFADNLEDREQTRDMIRNTQHYASTPLFIAVDEEGGEVARVAEKLDTKKFYPMFYYRNSGEQIAHDVAKVNAFNIRRFGFNMDNAPVADVMSSADSAIGKRAYSDDFEQAATLVASAVKGYDDGEVISVLKHFPGHGSVTEDTHDGEAVITRTVDELKANELLPFKAGIDAGADMVMVGHLTVNALDKEMPASLSDKVVPELLRKELGYDGIVITDSMMMGAVSDYDYDSLIKGLFAADVDIILMPDNLDKYLNAMEKALKSGAITQDQIDAKVTKILALKYKQGILKADTAAVAAETTAPTEAAAATEAATVPAGTVAATTAPTEAVTTALPTETAAPVQTPSVAA